ncbi:uncharacterized protein [Coffea arabica]|uniref:Reverse transcriptase domain-containing protein n=1 Tax=Coffea arabica TaxID=13443 RepID=A0ABM4VCJ1_COFAR
MSKATGLIQRMALDSDNELLEGVPAVEEVRHMIFSMDGDSAAGPDGYPGKFFTFAWDIIAQDIYNAVVSFFCGEEVPRRVATTFIVLNPKVQNPASFAQFRPISLCNFLNKVLSRILADKLAPLLPRIISPNQSGFVRGRQMSYNYLLAQECPGFCGFKVPRACPSITHLGFADDILIFSSASTTSLKLLMETLVRYESISGQSINTAKSEFMVHSTLSRGRRALIQRITGFSKKEFPVRYLSCPLFVRRQKKDFFQDLSNMVYSKISSWKNRLLSPGSKVVLIKYVLSSIPLHLLGMVHPPKSTLVIIERLFANFLWGSAEGIAKHHWIRWRDLCAAKEEGGLGFRSLFDVVRAFSVKL